LQTCLPEVGFLTLTDKTKLWLLGLLEDCLFDFISSNIIYCAKGAPTTRIIIYHTAF
jgi:hypothetical protein